MTGSLLPRRARSIDPAVRQTALRGEGLWMCSALRCEELEKGREGRRVDCKRDQVASGFQFKIR